MNQIWGCLLWKFNQVALLRDTIEFTFTFVSVYLYYIWTRTNKNEKFEVKKPEPNRYCLARKNIKGIVLIYNHFIKMDKLT